MARSGARGAARAWGAAAGAKRGEAQSKRARRGWGRRLAYLLLHVRELLVQLGLTRLEAFEGAAVRCAAHHLGAPLAAQKFEDAFFFSSVFLSLVSKGSACPRALRRGRGCGGARDGRPLGGGGAWRGRRWRVGRRRARQARLKAARSCARPRAPALSLRCFCRARSVALRALPSSERCAGRRRALHRRRTPLTTYPQTLLFPLVSFGPGRVLQGAVARRRGATRLRSVVGPSMAWPGARVRARARVRRPRL